MEQLVQYLAEENYIVVGFLGSLAAGLMTALGALALAFAGGAARRYRNPMLGFAAGVMVAATAFSLVQAGIEEASSPVYGASAMFVGILIGGTAVDFFDRRFPYERAIGSYGESSSRSLGVVWLFVIAIAVHNFPEGLAVGAGFGEGGEQGIRNGLTLAVGIGLQNVAEGLAVGAALLGEGYGTWKAIVIATATGLVEPLGGVLGASFVNLAQPLLPWGMALAAGAMLFVIVDELVPQMHEGSSYRAPTFAVLVGFVVMMFLDTTLG